MRKKKKKHEHKTAKSGIKEDIARSVRESIKRNLENYKEDMIKRVEKDVEKDFSQRIEKLETKVEKDVEDFLMKKFDGIFEQFTEDIKKERTKVTTVTEDGKTVEIPNVSDIREHIKEIMDIQEEMISKMHQKKNADTSDITKQLNDISSSVNANSKEIRRIALQIEDFKKSRTPAAKPNINLDEIKGDFEEKFFNINKKLEQSKIDLRGEISRVDNKTLPSPPEPQKPQEDLQGAAEMKEELLSKISELKKEVFDLKQRKRSRIPSAVILE